MKNKVRIGMDVDPTTADWIRKLKTDYGCESNRELFLLSLSTIEDKGVPPEVHQIAQDKGQIVEENPQEMLWRNILLMQRKIDNLQVRNNSDRTALVRMMESQRKMLNIYTGDTMKELVETMQLFETKIQEYKDERAQLEAVKRREREYAVEIR